MEEEGVKHKDGDRVTVRGEFLCYASANPARVCIRFASDEEGTWMPLSAVVDDKRCRAETTIRDDEHRTYRCLLPLDHPGNHESGQMIVEWTDATTRPRRVPNTPDARFLQYVGGYIDDWRDGDDAWHAAGHIEELIRERKLLRERLLDIWQEAHDTIEKTGGQSGMAEEFATWSGATKDFLMFLGLEWDNTQERYIFVDRERRDA